MPDIYISVDLPIMMSLTSEEKRKFLRALKEDDEFRYAIAGLIGYKEILDRLAEHDRKFEEIVQRLEAHDRKFEEILDRLAEHDRKFEEMMERLSEYDRKFNDIVERLRIHDRKFEEIVQRLEAHDRKFEEIIGEMREVREGLRRIEATIERFSLTLEEEAREIVSWLLRERGIDVELSPVKLAGVEFDLYGETDELIVIGEVKTRLSAKRVEEFASRVEKLLKIRPEIGKKRVIKVIYTMVVQAPALKEAEDRDVLIATAKGFLGGRSLDGG